jgi:putative tricarboxylic transport membrane protein
MQPDSQPATGPATAPAAATSRWQDTALGVGVLLLALLVGWQTTIIPENALYARVGPRVFPWIATGLLAVMGVLLTLQGLRGGWEHDQSDDIDWRGLGWLAAGLIFNVLFIGGIQFDTTTVIPKLGFIISSTVLFVCTARSFASTQPVRDAAIGFTLAILAYVGFDRVLGYKIGSGLIEALI